MGEMRKIYEYATDKLLIHMCPTDLLIVDGMQVLHRIEESDNIEKRWFKVLPVSNEETFPFIAMSGFNSLNLLNTEKRTIQPLIKTPIKGFNN